MDESKENTLLYSERSSFLTGRSLKNISRLEETIPVKINYEPLNSEDFLLPQKKKRHRQTELEKLQVDAGSFVKGKRVRQQVTPKEIAFLTRSVKRKENKKPREIKNYRTEEQNNKVVAKGTDKKYNRSGMSEEVFNVRRIICRRGDDFIVHWDGVYNFTHCTQEGLENLEGASELLEQFEIYDRGMEAIKRNIESNEWYKRQEKPMEFKRHAVPLTGLKKSDATIKNLLAARDQKFINDIGYWGLKMIELKWQKIYDPDVDLKVPALYIESMIPHADYTRIMKDFKFIVDYKFSAIAFTMLQDRSLERRHLCLFGEKKDYCEKCRGFQEFKVTSNSSVEIPSVVKPTQTHFVLVCNMGSCVCESWQTCQSSFSAYPRKDPLVIFYEPRYKGWGVRTLVDMPKGRIVSEYVGIIYGFDESEKFNDSTYQMETPEKNLVIDTKKEGNESRFFAHSCEPNMLLLAVYVRGFDMAQTYRHILVTSKPVAAGEELTFNYNPNKRKKKTGKVKCNCGAKCCKGWLF